MPRPDLVRQPSFFETDSGVDTEFTSLERLELDAESWVDLVPRWVSGDGLLFDEIVAVAAWDQRTRWMYTRPVIEPRLTARWATGASSVPATSW